MKALMCILFLFSLKSQAKEIKGKICIDGKTFQQIKCEKFTNLTPIKKDPKLLKEIEKMYPPPPKENEDDKKI